MNAFEPPQLAVIDKNGLVERWVVACGDSEERFFAYSKEHALQYISSKIQDRFSIRKMEVPEELAY